METLLNDDRKPETEEFVKQRKEAKIRHECNLQIISKGLDLEEREILEKTIRRINAKRRRRNEPRLSYMIKLG